MAKTSSNKKNDKNNITNINQDKAFRRQLNNINSMIGQANLTMYGTDRTSDVDTLNKKFQKLLDTQIGDITNRTDSDITSFLGQIISNDNKTTAIDELISSQFMSMSGDDYSTMQSFIYDAYRNKLLEQSDLHEVASQLIELTEAINITRDAIISADVVEGIMSRTLKFTNVDEDEIDDTISMVETMEKNFALLEKIKNFVVPKTLEYGEYYAYTIPYSKLFEDIERSREKDGYGSRLYRESTIMESFDPTSKDKNDEDNLNAFLESTYEKFNVQDKTKSADKSGFTSESSNISKDEFFKDMKNIMSNISICNDDVPIPFLEEGMESVEYIIEKGKENNKNPNSDWFSIINTEKRSKDGGVLFTNDDKNKKKKKDNFKDVTGCYIKMIDPTKVIPLDIMNTNIGYFYVVDEDITPLSGAVSSTLYYTKFDEHRRETTVIDAIAERVVKSFNKPFLMSNIKFKEAIVDCFNYYNLNEKRLKFQFIPSQYMQKFKIDVDENGNGTSMIKKSLFYAKLYLMLLLFKIMSIILNSNDTKVNYIKQSGIDKNIANKVQEIARIRQSRQINITDLFSYTTLINKVGNGTELYIPTGRSGDRPIETEILQGQDVQLNTELMEMLKNAYILATGVPAAIINYLNEADFAKTVEQNNTKFNGRVVNYQLDFNRDITEWYKKIMRWSTNIPENIIECFSFILQPPKATVLNTKSELISQFNNMADFLVQICYDDPNASMNAETLNKEIREFKKLLIKDLLPMIDLDNIEKLMEKAKINVTLENLKPDPNNGDNGDDIGLEDDINMDTM